MPPSPAQLKDKLLKGLDEDNDVVNTSVVVEVIDVLERVALTRQDLEVTRLGLYINKVRKKTSDPDISRRCRKLLKAWQQLVNSAPSNHASPASSVCSPVSVTNHSVSTVSPRLPSHNLSPALKNHRNNAVSPKTNYDQLTSPASVSGRVSSPAGRLVSPLVRNLNSNGVKPYDTSLAGTNKSDRISSSNRHTGTIYNILGQKPSSPYVNNVSSGSSTPSYSVNQEKMANHLTTGSRPHTPTNNNHTNNTPNLDLTNRTHAANKKRRRSEDSIGSDASSVKKNRNNGEVRERTKTPKVKTTVELIAELQATKSSSITSSETITKIVTNQIEKEKDDIRVSVVPAGARPRQRRKNGSLINPPEAPPDMSKTKSDLVHRYLQTAQLKSDTPSPTEDMDVDVEGLDTVDMSVGTLNVFNSPPCTQPVIDNSVDPYSLLPAIDYNNISWSDDEPDDGVIQRNPITGEYPEGYEDDIPAELNGSHMVDRIMSEDWPGVTGSSDRTTNHYHDWTETFIVSTSSNSNDYVYVLPYVDI